MAASKCQAELREVGGRHLNKVISRGKSIARLSERAPALPRTDKVCRIGRYSRLEKVFLERERNEAKAAISWRFAIQDARTKLRRSYPTYVIGLDARQSHEN